MKKNEAEFLEVIEKTLDEVIGDVIGKGEFSLENISVKTDSVGDEIISVELTFKRVVQPKKMNDLVYKTRQALYGIDEFRFPYFVVRSSEQAAY